MAAVLTDRVRPVAPGRVDVLTGRPAPGQLRLYRPADATAGRPRREVPAVYRRRRLVAAGLGLLFVAAVLVVAQLIGAGTGGGPLTTTGAAAGPGIVPAGATSYVVRPGDTLWSIAAALAPGRDERPLVDRLAKEIGGVDLYPGEVIPIPATR